MILTAFFAVVGCNNTFEMDLPLAVSSRLIDLTKDAGSTHIIIYADGDWTAKFTETTEWASLDRLNGNGNSEVVLSYSANYGLSRRLAIALSKNELKDTIVVNQAGMLSEPSIAWPCDSIALNKTGLAENLVESIPFASFSPLVVLLLSGFIAYLLSNFIANSAAANLLVPILCAVGVGMGELLDPVGGARALIIGVALSTSFAMLFPISTPPNAIAHSTGLIQVKDMTKVGLIIGVIGFVLSYAILIFIGI